MEETIHAWACLDRRGVEPRRNNQRGGDLLNMAFSDQTLKCRDCGKDFVWTASEQDFYAQKGFTNAPARCAECRQAKKQQSMGERTMYPITCASCGRTDQVPFEPKGDRPVLCGDCFRKSKGQNA